jgi:hypothetical protein
MAGVGRTERCYVQGSAAASRRRSLRAKPASCWRSPNHRSRQPNGWSASGTCLVGYGYSSAIPDIGADRVLRQQCGGLLTAAASSNRMAAFCISELTLPTPMHRSQLGIDIRIEVAERRAGLPADGPPLTMLDIVFGGHAEQRSWLNATKFVRTIRGAVTRILRVRATHQPACPASERVVKSPMCEPMALSLLCA